MSHSLRIEPAPVEAWESACRLLFQYLPEDEGQLRALNALRLLEQREIDPAGLWIARQGRAVVGALVCMIAPGASGLVWPPQSCPPSNTVEDQLLRHASAWLRSRGARLAQTLLAPAETHLAEPLLRNEFQHTTRLAYLRRTLDTDELPMPRGRDLTFARFDEVAPELFHTTLLRTYEGTLDCPEVNGLRTIEEIITGHQAQGRYDPGRWWLAQSSGRPIGVLLTTEIPEWQGWDLSYLGVVPEARGQRLGHQLTLKALSEAQRAGASQLTLSVDLRNRPACKLYERLHFRAFDEREVFLAIWGPPGQSRAAAER